MAFRNRYSSFGARVIPSHTEKEPEFVPNHEIANSCTAVGQVASGIDTSALKKQGKKTAKKVLTGVSDTQQQSTFSNVPKAEKKQNPSSAGDRQKILDEIHAALEIEKKQKPRKISKKIESDEVD